MKNFEIDPAYLCQFIIREEWSMFRNKENLTEEELIKVLMGRDRCSSIRSDDEPHFKELREYLGNEGYIKIERGWWNGDKVLKPFTVNGAKFKKGEQFHCGAAIRYTIEYKLKEQEKRRLAKKNTVDKT